MIDWQPNEIGHLRAENERLRIALQKAYDLLDTYKDGARYKRGLEYCEMMEEIAVVLESKQPGEPRA